MALVLSNDCLAEESAVTYQHKTLQGEMIVRGKRMTVYGIGTDKHFLFKDCYYTWKLERGVAALTFDWDVNDRNLPKSIQRIAKTAYGKSPLDIFSPVSVRNGPTHLAGGDQWAIPEAWRKTAGGDKSLIGGMLDVHEAYLQKQ
jgi:hypothetical protein